MSARVGRAIFAGLVVAGVSGCELQEITVAEAESLVVVEALAEVGAGGNARVRVLLHETPGGNRDPVPGARVRVRRPDGMVLALDELTEPAPCVPSGGDSAGGTCYRLSSMPGVAPGMRLELEVETVSGHRLRGVTTLPGDFQWVSPDAPQGACTLPPDTPLPLDWTPSDGAWAYVTETEIFGLRRVLEPRGITVLSDPLYLLGISIASDDTSIVFPGEFGVFERADLDRDLAVYLQGGVPPGTVSLVTVAAVDRNYVNWVRGGNFNPSGAVRIPSVEGDGTGFFGSAVVRDLRILVSPGPDGLPYQAPSCRSG